MPHVKPAVAITAVAMILCGCSTAVKPPQGRGHIEDPRTDSGRLQCLLSRHFPAREVGRTEIQIGPLPAGPTIQFAPSSGAAESRQVDGTAQGAEVIGTALLYPHGASDADLNQIENCVAEGMSG
jgi:hypothetical protein